MDGKLRRSRPPAKLKFCGIWLAAFVIIALLASCMPALADSPWYNFRNASGYNNCYSYTGSARGSLGGGWYNSGNACTFGTVRTATPTDYFTLYADNTDTDSNGKALGVAGGYYDVIVYPVGTSGYMGTNIKITGQIMDGSAKIVSGLHQNVWAIPSSLCNGQTVGRIRLNPGGTTTQIKFYPDGATIAGAPNLWYVNTINLNNVTPALTSLALSTDPVDGSGGTAVSDNNYTTYQAGETVTVTANAASGYHFQRWKNAGGTTLSTANPYVFAKGSGTDTVIAEFTQTPLITVIVNPSTAGTTTGQGFYNVGGSCTLAATANSGYTFSQWTQDQAGTIPISTANPYTFTVSASATIYAQFTVNQYPLTQAVTPAGGGSFTAGSTSGSVAYNSTCTESAVPAVGYDFKGWSTDGGTTIASRAAYNYTFNMPAAPLTITAVFAPQTKFVFWDGFDGYKGSGNGTEASSSAQGILDSNATGTPANGGVYNQTANGTGSNPWWGCTLYNGVVLTSHDACVAPHAGSPGGPAGTNKMISGWQGLQADDMNFAFRKNAGNCVSGGFYADWWFYDYVGSNESLGSSTDSTTNYKYVDDAFTVGNLKNYSPTADYATTTAHYADGDFYSRISLGCGNDVGAGWDGTKYQARIFSATGYPSGVAGAYGSLGWINLPATRSAGWHHGRMVFGAVKTSGTNDVSFYIDDMNTPQLTTDTYSPYVGYNLLEFQEMYWQTPLTHALPYFCVWDDVSVSSVPGILYLSLSATTVAPSSALTATFDGVGADHYVMKIDTGAWSTVTSPASINTSALAYGVHTVYVAAVDGSGNQGASAIATFRVDRSILTWNIIGHYPWQSGTASGSTRFGNDFFVPASTELLAGAKTGLSYASTVVPTPQAPGIAYTAWTPYTSPNPIVDLNVVYNSVASPYTQYGVSYLCTYVLNSGAPISNAYFTCGSDDGVKLWVNGNYIGGNDTYRGCTINSDIYGPFTLNAGGNKLLIKVTQGTSGYQFQGQLCDATKFELPAVTSGQLTYQVSDDAGPNVGSVIINGGASTTRSLTVTLTLAASDALNPVTQMRFSNDDGTWSDPIPFSNHATWLLNANPGLATVYAEFADSCGNWSSEFTGTINVPSGWALTTQGCVPGAGTPTGDGIFSTGNSVTVHANTNPGYTFVSWTRDSCGGFDVASRSADYTFSMPGWDTTLYANYTANNYTLTATACTGGTTSGAGSYQTGSSVNVVATPNTAGGYAFKNWTSDSCGGTAVVSTTASYTFNMPPNNYTLYANFTYQPLLTIVSNPVAGGTTTGGGAHYAAGSPAAITATPNTGYDFVDWSTDQAGLNVVSLNPNYSYTMPAVDTTLYAQFAAVNVLYGTGFEASEGYAAATMLDNQLWWKADYPNGNAPVDLMVQTSAFGITPHSGTQMATGNAASDWDSCCINLAYRIGGHANMPGNFRVSWWFYDPLGAGASANTYTDGLCLSNVSGIPMNADITSGTGLGWVQRFTVGAAGNQAAGFDATKYQIRCLGGTGYTSGWFNSAVTRSTGWHQGKIVVGPQLTNGTNLMDVYFDGNFAWEGNSTTTGGFNVLELNCAYTAAVGAFDDISITTVQLPSVSGLTITPGTVVDNSSVSASWVANYADHSRLQIDGGAWVDPATSPYTIPTTGLAYGTHTVSVQAVDASGRVSNVISATFTVDRSSIRTWNVIGHYTWDYNVAAGSTRWAKDFFDAPGISETNIFAKTGVSYPATSVTPGPRASWTPYTSPNRIVDFNVMYGGELDYGASYLFTYVVNSGAAIPNAFVTCGSDDGIKVWFNGALQGGADSYRGCVVDGDIYPATGGFTINPGPNTLLVKITQGGGAYAAQARICGAAKADPTWLSQLSFVVSDDNAPTGSIVINGGATSTSSANVTLTLAATDDLSGVAKMQFSNDGTTFGAPVAYATSAPYTLPGSDGLKTVYVEFIDGAGNISTPVSASITLSTAPPCTPPTGTTNVPKISGLWALVDGATVYNLTSKTVTALWTDGFWIEESDRTAGVKVAYNPATACTVGAAIAAGNSVDVYGTISTGDQRTIVASVVVNHGAGNPIKPVGVIEKYTGGAQKSNAPAVTGGKGIYGVGLLVKLAGTVTSADTVGGTFYLDDGSGLTDGANVGIKVLAGALAVPTSGTKEVTGVVGIVAGKPVIYATSIQ